MVRRLNKQRVVGTVLSVLLVPTLLVTGLFASDSSEPKVQVKEDVIYLANNDVSSDRITLIPEGDKETTIDIIERERVDILTDYIHTTFNVNKERAELLSNAIQDNATETFDDVFITGLITVESQFTNNYAELYPLEDSMGYVQMKSDTIRTMKNVVPSLPTINSQEEFQANPEIQIKYAVAYLEFIKAELDTVNIDKIISAYNRGHNSKQFNEDYVIKTLRVQKAISDYFLENKHKAVEVEL